MTSVPISSAPSTARVLAISWLGAALVSLDYTAVTIALPTLSQTFTVGTSLVSWLSLAYLLAVSSMLLPASGFLGYFGFKRGTAIGFALFALASVGCAVSESLAQLVAFRIIQGAAGAILYVAGPIFIQTLIDEDRRSTGFRFFATAAPAGLCAGPVIGGLVTQFAGWQWIFLINLPLAAAALVTVAPANWSPKSWQPYAPSMSTLAAATAGAFTFVLALNQGEEWGWTSVAILGLLASACLAAGLCAYFDRHSRNPLIPRGLLRVGSFVSGTASLSFYLVAFGGLVFLLPFFLQWHLRLSPHATGLILAVQPLAYIGSATLGNLAFPSRPPVVPAVFGLVLLAAGFACLAFPAASANIAVLILALALAGAGSGLFSPAILQILLSDLGEAIAVAGASLQSVARVQAQLLGVVCFETIFSQIDPTVLSGRDHAAASPYGYAAAFAFGVLCLALAGLFLFRAVPGSPQQSETGVRHD